VSDALIAACVLVAAEFEAYHIADDASARPLAMVLVAVMTATLAFRRVAPLPGVVVLFAAAIPLTLSVDESENFSSPFLMVLIWGYTLGALPDVRTALRGLALAALGIVGVSASFADPVVGDFIFPIGFTSAAWGAGRAIQHRTRLAAELHEAALRAEEDRETQAARAVADERRRIAREMHDVVAHSVSVMVVQAGGARRILERDPERAVEAARLIERTGRGALLEMRRLLGVLGSTEEGAAMAPQPRLEELHPLIARAREAGLPVTIASEGERRPLPAGAEAAVYRVVQEALTNAMKHAPGAPTEVVLRWDEESLEVSVTDSGPGGAHAAALPGGGHGIVGMRERVRVYGGELSARPRAGGGFVVRARIPLQQRDLVTA
jgi:signal transduction histidine kinase